MPVWADDRLGRLWWTFHVEHPEVGARLASDARALVARGYAHLGIGMLWEVLRYRTMLGAGPDEDAYRLNDHHRALYARWLMETDPVLAGIFELRARRSTVGS